MAFDAYQACLNALCAADRQLNLVPARGAASGAAGSPLDAFQLLRLALVQCLERLEQPYARQSPDHERADVCTLLEAQRAREGQRAGALVCRTCSGAQRQRRGPSTPHGPTAA